MSFISGKALLLAAVAVLFGTFATRLIDLFRVRGHNSLLPLVQNEYSWNRIGLLAGVNGTVENAIDEFYQKASEVGVNAALTLHDDSRVKIMTGDTGFLLVLGSADYDYLDPPESEAVSRLDAIELAVDTSFPGRLPNSNSKFYGIEKQ